MEVHISACHLSERCFRWSIVQLKLRLYDRNTFCKLDLLYRVRHDNYHRVLPCSDSVDAECSNLRYVVTVLRDGVAYVDVR